MNKEGTEENFLRAKNTAVYESNNMVTDVQSGEILYQEKSTKVKTSTEPDFIKVYYKAMMAVNAISEIPLDFLLALSAQIGFTNGDKIMFYNNKTTRRAISEYCNIGDNMTACTKFLTKFLLCIIIIHYKVRFFKYFNSFSTYKNRNHI